MVQRASEDVCSRYMNKEVVDERGGAKRGGAEMRILVPEGLGNECQINYKFSTRSDVTRRKGHFS